MYTLKIKGIEVGSYTVTETTKDITGKEVTVTYSVNNGEKVEGDSAKAEVKADETTTVTFEDNYTKKEDGKTGDLELTKTIKGDVTEEEAEGALTFEIKTSDGKYLKADGTLTSSREEAKLTLKDFEHKAGTKVYTLKIKGIEVGSYTVTETTKDINGKDVTVTYQVDDGVQTKGDSAAFDIRENATTHVAYEDAYTVKKDDGSGKNDKTDKSGTASKTGSKSKSGSSVKTGDESPIAAWTALLALSALGMAFAIKNRKKDDEA